MTQKYLFTLLFTLGLFCKGNAQSTFDDVYTILQTNCAISSCHGGADPIAFDLGTTPTTTFNAIVGVNPSNPAALAKKNKLVDPGHPYNSFLLRKIGHNLDSYLTLDQPEEGGPMPVYGASTLTNIEIEMIRQWILWGAKSSGNQVNKALIEEYYTDGGIDFMPTPGAPDPSEGIQVRLGPIFLDKSGNNTDEIEYLKKEHLNFDADKEVVKVEGYMNEESHHFLLFKFDDVAGANQEDDGLRVVSVFNTATDGDKELQALWQYTRDYPLPEGTAFYWNQDDWLDLNYHIKNYSQDEILAADFYLNIYTEPRGSGSREMRAEMPNNVNLFIPPGPYNTTMTDTWSGDDREIWLISSHTHKLGTDFDIYHRNPDGSQGDQIYEGFYNSDYTFNQGFYDWQHPAVRIFDSLYVVKSNEGLIFKTEWDNTTGGFVTFGLTTSDEMQLSSYLYVNKNEIVISRDEMMGEPTLALTAFPNPVKDQVNVQYELIKNGSVSIHLVDALGKESLLLPEIQQVEGTHMVTLKVNNQPSGIYFVKLITDFNTIFRKIVITQ